MTELFHIYLCCVYVFYSSLSLSLSLLCNVLLFRMCARFCFLSFCKCHQNWQPKNITGNVYADIYESHLRGPSFVMEPPSRLDFSNSSGGWLDCSATGTPHPTIDWISMDSTSVGDVSGVRRVLRNGTLVLLPFSAAAYRQDIHNTIYRCVASNSVGRIISRDVQVRAGECQIANKDKWMNEWRRRMQNYECICKNAEVVYKIMIIWWAAFCQIRWIYFSIRNETTNKRNVLSRKKKNSTWQLRFIVA